jgi:hypothetical protein
MCGAASSSRANTAKAGGPIAGAVDYEQSDRNPKDRSVAVHRWHSYAQCLKIEN